MRLAATALVVAAVAAVAIAAVVDAVRPQPEPALDAEAAAQLAEVGAAGTLIYADPSCRVRALSLPALRPESAPEGEQLCRFSASPDGRRIADASVHWSADGRTCTGACAWRGSTLAFAGGGEIRSGDRVLVPRAELERAARGHPNAPGRLAVDELRLLDLAWTPEGELVALITARYRLGIPEFQTTVAAFRDGRLAWERPYLGGYERLAVSSRGVVLPEPAHRTQTAHFAGLDPTGPIDWSPDGRLLAVATRASVFVVDPEAPRRIRIPVTAYDLAWR